MTPEEIQALIDSLIQGGAFTIGPDGSLIPTGQGGTQVPGTDQSFFDTPFGLVPIDALAGIADFLNATNQSAIANAQIQASLAGSTIQAQASLAGAGISANAQLQAASLAASTELTKLNATIRKDIQLANAGFRLDNDQHNSNLRRQAELSNAQKSLEVAGLAGSGDARNNIARLLAIGSGAETPGAFSGFSGIPSPFLDPEKGFTSFEDIPVPDPVNFDFSFDPIEIPQISAPSVPTIPDPFADFSLDFGDTTIGDPALPDPNRGPPVVGGDKRPSALGLLQQSAQKAGLTMADLKAAGVVGGSPEEFLKDALAKGILKSFARGGVSRGPTIGVVGDSPDGKQNKELVIAPGGMKVIPLGDGVDLEVPHFQTGTGSQSIASDFWTKMFGAGLDPTTPAGQIGTNFLNQGNGGGNGNGGDPLTNSINLFGKSFNFDPDISDVDLLKGPLAELLTLPSVRRFGQGFNQPLQARPRPDPTDLTGNLAAFNPTGARFAGIPNRFAGAARFAGLPPSDQKFLSEFLTFLGIRPEEQAFQQKLGTVGAKFSPRRALAF